MTKRDQFTRELASLLQYMLNEGDTPILDFVKRSTEEQARLFAAGLSKCDGVKIVSKHQSGLAADIYLLDMDGKLVNWNSVPEKSSKYHAFWDSCSCSGRMVIEWDRGHFEF